MKSNWCPNSPISNWLFNDFSCSRKMWCASPVPLLCSSLFLTTLMCNRWKYEYHIHNSKAFQRVSKKLSKEAITDITLTLMSEMTHIDAGVWMSLPKYDWHYVVITSRHVTHVTRHTCHECVMRIIRHYLTTLRSLVQISQLVWSCIILALI